jgi:Ca2+-binding RTX toxin-like protein
MPVAVACALTLALVVPSLGSAGIAVPTCHGKPATVVGTPGDDHFSSGYEFGDGDVVVLLGGDDRGVDQARDVTICGDGGRDTITATGTALGEQTLLDGGSGADKLGDTDDPDYVGRGPLTLYGGDGNDLLLGTGQLGPHPGGNDTMFGGRGADYIAPGRGNDRVHGSKGNDTIYAGDQNDRIYGDDGDDDLFGRHGNDLLIGGLGDDLAKGGPQFDTCKAELEFRCEADPF